MLIKPPCTERYARWCERTRLSQKSNLSQPLLFLL